MIGSLTRPLIMVLAVLVTVAMSLSAVQASGMASKMTMMSDMGASVGGDCHQCSGGEETGKAAACSVFCTAPAVATVPQILGTAVFESSRLALTRSTFLHGRNALPDPFPPRSSNDA